MISDELYDIIENTINEIQGYAITHFKEKSFGASAPSHYYITFIRKDMYIVCTCTITSQPIEIYKNFPYANKSIVTLPKDTFYFCKKDCSFINCNVGS